MPSISAASAADGELVGEPVEGDVVEVGAAAAVGAVGRVAGGDVEVVGGAAARGGWRTPGAGVSGDAEAAVGALADAGLILGLDLREYDDDGKFYEIAWGEYERTGRGDVEQALRAALVALARPDRTGDAVLITWQGA
jgi:hypothetical protein